MAEVLFEVRDGAVGRGRMAITEVVDDVAGAEHSEAVVILRAVPSRYALDQNYPNPFNPNTTIHYTLPSVEHRAESN